MQVSVSTTDRARHRVTDSSARRHSEQRHCPHRLQTVPGRPLPSAALWQKSPTVTASWTSASDLPPLPQNRNLRIFRASPRRPSSLPPAPNSDLPDRRFAGSETGWFPASADSVVVACSRGAAATFRLARRRWPQPSACDELGPSTYSLPLPAVPRLTMPSIARRLVIAVSTSGHRASGITRTGDAGCTVGS
jgi:hypothetical protein